MRFEVLVVGAGPAGCVAATLLARRGKAVALVAPDSATDCKIGECLSSAGERLLQQLELPGLTESASHAPIRSVLSAWASPPTVQDFLLQTGGGGFRLDRVAFDRTLRERARACVQREECDRIVRIERREHTWYLETAGGAQLSAELLVDASGRRATVARRLGVARHAGPALIAVWAVGRRPCVEQAARREQTLIEACAEGWWYGAWLPDGRPLAAFHTSPAQARGLRRPAAWLARLQESKILSRQLELTLFDSASIRTSDARGARLEHCVGEGWIACGDAALTFEPLAAQGIFNALATAAMAARTLLSPASEQRRSAEAHRHHARQIEKIWAHYAAQRAALYRQGEEHFASPFWRSMV